MAKSSTSILSGMVKRMKAGADEPLRELIDEYLVLRRRAETRLDLHQISMMPRPRPPGRFSPSSVCGCSRASVFKFTGVRGKDKSDPEMELIFENGDWFHHKWQALFYDMQIVLGSDRFKVIGIEMPILIPELYIAGSLDAEVLIKIEGRWKKYIIDIKSINSYGFSEVLNLQAALPAHERQVTTYAKGRGVKRGLLLYENKNDNRVECFAFNLDEGVWHDVTEWVEGGIRALQDEVLPPMHPECQGGSFMYEKCPYSHLCFGKKPEEQVVELVYGNKRWKGIDNAWRRSTRDDLSQT